MAGVADIAIDRAAAIRCARVYLREARMRAKNPVQRGFCFTLLAWAANQRRQAMAAIVPQVDEFDDLAHRVALQAAPFNGLAWSTTTQMELF